MFTFQTLISQGKNCFFGLVHNGMVVIKSLSERQTEPFMVKLFQDYVSIIGEVGLWIHSTFVYA